MAGMAKGVVARLQEGRSGNAQFIGEGTRSANTAEETKPVRLSTGERLGVTENKKQTISSGRAIPHIGGLTCSKAPTKIVASQKEREEGSDHGSWCPPGARRDPVAGRTWRCWGSGARATTKVGGRHRGRKVFR